MLISIAAKIKRRTVFFWYLMRLKIINVELDMTGLDVCKQEVIHTALHDFVAFVFQP